LQGVYEQVSVASDLLVFMFSLWKNKN